MIGAGVPEPWVREGDGLDMTGLRTYYGPLDLRMRAEESTVRVTVGGDLRCRPAASSSARRWTAPSAARRSTAARFRVDADAREVVVRAVPADVVLEH